MMKADQTALSVATSGPGGKRPAGKKIEAYGGWIMLFQNSVVSGWREVR